jgi:hypothetical protein
MLTIRKQFNPIRRAIFWLKALALITVFVS